MSAAEPMSAEIAVQLARIEAKIDVALARVDTKLDTGAATMVDHEGRIRVLERKVWLAAGAAGAVSAGLAQFLGR